MGGSLVITIPEIELTISIMLNDYFGGPIVTMIIFNL